jgi:homopolymeric O-antigen transport system permease protein
MTDSMRASAAEHEPGTPSEPVAVHLPKAEPSSRVITIRPAKRRVRISELWRTLDVAWVIAARDLKLLYKQSVLGPAWLVVQPLGVLTGLIVAFHGVTTVNTDPIPYLLFALVSVSAWTFIQNTINKGTLVYTVNSFLVRRVAFPRSSLFSAVILAGLLPFAVIFVPALMAVAVDRGLPLQVLLLPIVMGWLTLLVLGIMFIFGSLVVRFRDIGSLVPFWLQVGVFVTPVGYPLTSAPQHLRTLLALNPLTGILEVWRWCIFGTGVELLPLVIGLVGTAVLFVGGWWVFTRLEVRFADFI